jgi:lytic murein transglycosylase
MIKRPDLRAFVFLRTGNLLLACVLGLLAALAAFAKPAHADAKLDAWIEGVWPEAQAAGVSRKTFEAAFKGFTPDLKLPDLDLPGRPSNDARGQAEFTRAPAEYLDRAYLLRLAATGKELAAKHKATLEKIERELGVDRFSVLAIWGRETAFGQHKLPHDAINVVATLAYVGRRKDLFRVELIAALKMLESGIPRSLMRASWAGAMGLTQFMPSEYFKHAHDLDGDGKTDIWNSVPDALASAASQLKGKGWVAGQTWGYEVILTREADCGYEGPTQERPISEWAKLGLKRANGRPWTDAQLALSAYMMSPAGGYGPSFLVLENYKVIRRYNMSDLYAVFVGNLADRIAGGGDFVTPWGGTGPQKTSNIEEIQQRLMAAGYDVEKIDGKVGSNTRKVIGLYERTNKLKVDCWPSDTVLDHIRKTAAR